MDQNGLQRKAYIDVHGEGEERRTLGGLTPLHQYRHQEGRRERRGLEDNNPTESCFVDPLTTGYLSS